MLFYRQTECRRIVLRNVSFNFSRYAASFAASAAASCVWWRMSALTSGSLNLETLHFSIPAHLNLASQTNRLWRMNDRKVDSAGVDRRHCSTRTWLCIYTVYSGGTSFAILGRGTAFFSFEDFFLQNETDEREGEVATVILFSTIRCSFSTRSIASTVGGEQ